MKPACVEPGGVASLRVETKPKAGVVWQALYADGNSGAVPPWGKGYGGNDKGFANAKGVYEASWPLTANAPLGPAKVQVVAGTGDGQAQTFAHFTVASSCG